MSMSRVRAQRVSWRFPVFGGVLVAVYAVAAAIPRLGEEHLAVFAAALTFDLVITIPFAFYWVVMRPRGLPHILLVPVVAAGMVWARVVLPEDHRLALRVAEVLIAPLEAGLLVWVVVRVRRAVRASRAEAAGDPLHRISDAVRTLVPYSRPARVVASEVAMFYYALGAWRARPHAPDDAAAFTVHERSGRGGLVFGLILLCAIEGFALHFLIGRWSAAAAWVFTATNVYAMLWLLADHRATVLRPILVTGDEVWIRAGLRWDARFPRAGITTHAERPGPRRGSLRLTLLNPPTIWLRAETPVEADGCYGLCRRVSSVGLEPDDPAGLERALRG